MRTALQIFALIGLSHQSGLLRGKWDFESICESQDGDECCAIGMVDGGAFHEYAVIELSQNWEDHKIICMVDHNPDMEHTYDLVKIGSLRENDCLVKYLQDKYDGETRTFAIGLEQDGSYKNVFQWSSLHVEDLNSAYYLPVAGSGDTEHPESLLFNNWAPGMPSGRGGCVFITVGKNEPTSGLWKVGDCYADTNVWGICEKSPYKKA